MTQVMDEIAKKIKVTSITGINFVPLGKYYESTKSKIKLSGSDRIRPLIYARRQYRRWEK